MDKIERIKLLRSLALFSDLPEPRLADLADKLEPLALEDGAAFITEGTRSDGLYVIVSGRVRVAKRLGEGGEKDMAFLGPGDSLGEMEILHGHTRSASAYAQGSAQLMSLGSVKLRRWLDADAASAAGFFAKLAEIQSERLRRTSDEVALLYDLSQLLVTPQATAHGLLSHALERLTPHLQGEWSAEARAYNPFENELDLVARHGEPFSSDSPQAPPHAAADSLWTDDLTLTLVLRAPKRLLGTLRVRATGPLRDAERAEAERTLGAAARLLASALENLEFRTDEALRERLKMNSHGARL